MKQQYVARSSASLAAPTPSRRDGDPRSISSRPRYHDGRDRAPALAPPSPAAARIATEREREREGMSKFGWKREEAEGGVWVDLSTKAVGGGGLA
jgi:hypothetical protein